jgi:hypothetical protein
MTANDEHASSYSSPKGVPPRKHRNSVRQPGYLHRKTLRLCARASRRDCPYRSSASWRGKRCVCSRIAIVINYDGYFGTWYSPYGLFFHPYGRFFKEIVSRVRWRVASRSISTRLTARAARSLCTYKIERGRLSPLSRIHRIKGWNKGQSSAAITLESFLWRSYHYVPTLSDCLFPTAYEVVTGA